MNARKTIGNLIRWIRGSGKQATSTCAQKKVVRAHCNKCGHQTKHDVITECEHQTSDWVAPDLEVSWSKTYSMLECRGCEEVCLHRTEWCSEENHPMDKPDPGIYFPPRVSRRKPAWVDRLAVPEEYGDLLDEIYVALHADSRRLAAMGARALIDCYITRRVGDQGNFTNGLKKLVEKGFISEKQREIVSAAVDAGNASAHRGHCPSGDDISAVIDIVENLIHNELLTQQAQTLRANTPARPKPSAASAQQTP